ncbi:hypothetical protein [Natrarchaeobaculum sulfurireducens]|nr:hypothetical protein [Natrarchaeobaculum sulfurireducens]
MLIAFDLVEIENPRPVIEACERIGLETPKEAKRHPWALWGGRLEGATLR